MTAHPLTENRPESTATDAPSVGKQVPFPPAQSKLSNLITYRGNPLLRFEDLRDDYGPVTGFRLLGREVIVLHDPKAIEDVLVKKHHGSASFDLTVQQKTVAGVRISIDRE